MSMIGIQSTANHRQLNGLSSRVPYDVGRSIRTWNTTPIMAIATSIGNDASTDGGGSPRVAAEMLGDDGSRAAAALPAARSARRAANRRQPHTSEAVTRPRPTTP